MIPSEAIRRQVCSGFQVACTVEFATRSAQTVITKNAQRNHQKVGEMSIVPMIHQIIIFIPNFCILNQSKTHKNPKFRPKERAMTCTWKLARPPIANKLSGSLKHRAGAPRGSTTKRAPMPSGHPSWVSVESVPVEESSMMVLETSAGERRVPRGSPVVEGASVETETREHRRRRREEGYLRVEKRWGQKKAAFFDRRGVGRGEEGSVEERRAWGRRGIVGGEMKMGERKRLGINR